MDPNTIVRHEWVGGEKAGYKLLDSTGQEICRVWCEHWADEAIKSKMVNPEWLVDYILAKK